MTNIRGKKSEIVKMPFAILREHFDKIIKNHDGIIIDTINNINNITTIDENKCNIVDSKHPDRKKFSNNFVFTYSDSINCKNMIILEVIDLKFLLEHCHEMPLTIIFKTRYIFENGQKKFNKRLYYLFNIGNNIESRTYIFQ